MFAVKAKTDGAIYNQSSFIAFDETSSYWSLQKAPYFSAFHWSPHGSLVSIGQHFVTTRVEHFCGWSGSAMVLDKLPAPGRPTNLD